MSMDINFGKVGIYNELFHSLKLSDPLIRWSFDPLILLSGPLSHTIFWIRGHVSLLDKVKTFYLYNRDTYGYQNCQGEYIQYGVFFPWSYVAFIAWSS